MCNCQFVWGPLSLLTVLCVRTNHPSRHVFQIIVCVAHLYGVALYYATNWAEQRFHGVSYSRPEFLYFWVYYVGFNAPWAIVPFCELLQRKPSVPLNMHAPMSKSLRN